MKKTIICIILIVVFLGIFSTVSAEENETRTKIQVHKETGEIRFVTVDSSWRDASEEEKMAIKNFGKPPFVVDSESVTERVDFWHIQTKQLISRKGIFLQNNEIKEIYNETEKDGEKIFAPKIVFLLIAILLIVNANVFFFASKDGPGFLFALLSFVIFEVALLVDYWHIFDFFLITLYLIGFFSLLWSEEKGMTLNRDNDKKCSLVI